MKNIELYKVKDILKKYSNIKNKKFGYILYKNLEIIETVLDSINSLNTTPKELKEYESERTKICEKYSLRKNGEIEINDGKYVIGDSKSLNDEMNILDIKYEKYLNIKKKNMNRTISLLNSECNIIFEKIQLGDLLDNISGNDIKTLDFMISLK